MEIGAILQDLLWGTMQLCQVVVGDLLGVSRGLDGVYCICQEFCLGSNYKTDFVGVVSWGLLWGFDRVCFDLSGVLFGVP